MTNADDDVKVWVAARYLGQQRAEFTTQELLDQIQKTFKSDTKKMERFVAQQCIANAAGAGPKHYNYLFRTAPGRFRLFRNGDPIEFSHANAPTMPEVHRVPAEFKGLFTANKFPPELKPVGVAVSPAVESKAKTSPGSGKRNASAQAVTQTEVPETAAKGLKLDLSELDAALPSNIARKTLFDLLFLEMGKLGSRLETTKSDSFVINLEKHAGSVQTLQNLTVKMPSGAPVSHRTDLTVELESPARTLYIDIVEPGTRADELKATSFDALHLRKEGKHRYSVMVFLRAPHGILQEQAEAIAYPYDYFFGADANDAKNPSKFYGLKAQILNWVEGKVKPSAHGA